MYFDRRLFALTRGVRLRILFAAALGLIAVGAGVARLAVSGVVIYRVITGQASFSALTVPLMIIAALIVARSLFLYWQNAVSHHTANIVKIRLREQVYEHALMLGPGYADRNRTGDVVLTIVEGIERLETFFGQYLSQIIVSAVAPVAIFAYMVTLDPYIAIIFLLFAFLALVVPATFYRWNRDSSYRRRKSYGDLGSDFLDSVQGLATLKAFGQSKSRGRALAQRAHNLYKSTMGVVAANGATSGASILFMAMGAAIALAVGAVRVSNGDMELRPLLIVLMLGVEVFRPMRELTNLYHQGMTVLSSAQSVFGIMDEPVTIVESEAATRQAPTEITPEVSFEEVTFGYDSGYRPALHEVSFDLSKGETLGVVGASGAGKSTLVWLLYRFYDPQRGAIKVGGHDLRDLPLNVLRDNISVVTQDTYLFHGTVADNLRFGKPDATRQELEEAARVANAHEFISHLPHGYDTVVGERAVRLSGGQRQRLAIARALLKDAPILLLDEALSSVDAENESVIQAAMERLMENRTTLIIAHRLSSVIKADRILVLDEGRAVEIGSHAELMAADGTYAGLMRQQAQMGMIDLDAFAAPEPVRARVSVEQVSDLHPSGGGGNGRHNREPDHSNDRREDVNIRSLNVWVRLFGLVGPVKFQFLGTLALGLLHHSSVILLGAFSALLVGAVFRGDPLTTLLVLVCVFAPLSALLFYLESWQAHDMAFRLLARMRIDLYEKLEPLAPAYMVRRRSGDFVSVVGGDVETVEYFFAHAVSPMIVAVLIPAGLLAALAVISWPIAAVLAPFLVAVAVSPFFANARIERLGMEIRGRIGDIHAYMVDSIQGMREIVAFGRGPDRKRELTDRGWDYASHLVRFQKSQAFQIGFIEAMMGLGGLAVLAMGVWLVLEGQIARSELPLVSVLALASFSPVTELARTMKQMMETLAASRRILAVHDEAVPVQDGPGVAQLTDGAAPGTPSIDFEDVAFAYADGDPQALADASFGIESGQTVAIVGRSGAGKTTVAYLMMRFWDPDRGDIALEGHRLDKLLLDDLRGHMALVAQDTYLFNDTIRENIRLGRNDAADSEVDEAARQANAEEFIESLPDGYLTRVGERGMQLSGGQRQRIAIARAILKNAPVLILDEATSHLDAISEAAVRSALDRLMVGRTTVVMAHRLSTVRDADNILVLDEGVVVEQGKHEELLARGGLYAQLVATQLQGQRAVTG